jgi:RNA polymerase sigma-B factor
VSTPRAPSSRSGAAEARLFDRYARDGDVAARDALVDMYLPLARHLAWRFGRGSAHAEDLVQVASLGLLKAIERFDPGRGLAFSSFATPTIVGELKRYFRDKGWAVRVPRDLQERAVRVRRCAEELEGELGRAPTAAQLAERAGATIEEVLEAREAGDAQHGLSFSRPTRGADDGDEQTLGDRLGAEDHALSGAEDTVMIEGLMAHLDERERTILRLRFHEDLTQSEIGQQIGISQMHVSRLLRQALTRLRILAQDGDRPAA